MFTACDRVFMNPLHHGLVESIFSELFWLRGENAYLQKKLRDVKRNEKCCWNCGMKGHLARACCNRSRTDSNWRASEEPLVNSDSTCNATPWLPATPASTPINDDFQLVACESQRLVNPVIITNLDLDETDSNDSDDMDGDIDSDDIDSSDVIHNDKIGNSANNVLIKSSNDKLDDIDGDLDSDDIDSGDEANLLDTSCNETEHINIAQLKTGFWDSFAGESSMEMSAARLAHLPYEIIAVAEEKSREIERSQALIKAFREVFAAKDVDSIDKALNNCTFI